MAITLPYTANDGEIPTGANFMANFNQLINNPIDFWSPATKAADMNGFELILDADGDSSITADTDDQIDFRCGAEDVLSILEDGRYRFKPQALSGTPAISTGAYLDIAASTFTDSATAGSGTATAFAAHAIQRPTLAATNSSVTTTDAATFYIANSVAAGTNETITNTWALWVDAGNARFDDTVTIRAGSAFNGLLTHGITAARTWTLPDETGTVALTPVYNRVVRTAGDVTTNSTSLVDFTGASITFTTGANPVSGGASQNYSNGVAGSGTFFNINVDGTLLFGTDGVFFQQEASAGRRFNASFTFQTAALTAASHTVKLQWKVDGDTSTVDADSGRAQMFWAHEVR